MSHLNPEFFQNKPSELLGLQTKEILQDLGGFEDMIKEIDETLGYQSKENSQPSFGKQTNGSIII